MERYYHMLKNLDFILRAVSKRITCPDWGDEQREIRLKNWRPRGGLKRRCRTQGKFRNKT